MDVKEKEKINEREEWRQEGRESTKDRKKTLRNETGNMKETSERVSNWVSVRKQEEEEKG